MLRFISIISGADFQKLSAADTESRNRYFTYSFFILAYTAIYSAAGFGLVKTILQGSMNTAILVAIAVGVFTFVFSKVIVIGNGTTMVKNLRIVIVLALNLIAVMVIDATLFHQDLENFKSEVDQAGERITSSAEYFRLKTNVEEQEKAIESYRQLMTAQVEDNGGLGINAKMYREEMLKAETVKATIDQKIEALFTKDKEAQDIADQGLINGTMKMIHFMNANPLAWIIWGLFFVFLLGLELMLIVTKYKSNPTLYEMMVEQEKLMKLYQLTRGGIVTS